MERVHLITEILNQHLKPNRVFGLSKSFREKEEVVKQVRSDLVEFGLLRNLRGYGPGTVYQTNTDLIAQTLAWLREIMEHTTPSNPQIVARVWGLTPYASGMDRDAQDKLRENLKRLGLLKVIRYRGNETEYQFNRPAAARLIAALDRLLSTERT